MDLHEMYNNQFNSNQFLNKTYKSVSDLNYNDNWNMRRPSVNERPDMFNDRSLTSLSSMKDLSRDVDLKRHSGPEMINLLRVRSLN